MRKASKTPPKTARFRSVVLNIIIQASGSKTAHFSDTARHLLSQLSLTGTS